MPVRLPVLLLPVAVCQLLSSAIKAQSSQHAHLIRGVVRDSASNSALDGATITVNSLPDHGSIQTIRNTRNGFTLRLSNPGEYAIIASYLGYRPYTLGISIRNSDSAVINIQLTLHPEIKPLDAAIVTAKIPPMAIKGDTLVYNSAAYPTRPFATVEDLLRRLPGVQVDKDGKVTVNGKPVDKIYIDGKPFILGDIRNTTRLLPAEITSQLQAYETQSDEGRLSGIPDPTGGMTINIKLKKDAKHSSFGMVYAGAGNRQGYAAGGEATVLHDSRWISVNGAANNINNQFTGRDNNDVSGVAGIQTTQAANLTYRQEWGGVSANLTGSWEQVRNVQDRTTDHLTILGDSSLLQHTVSSSRNSQQTANIYGRITAHFDSLRTLEYYGRFGYSSAVGSTRDSNTLSIQPADGHPSWVSGEGFTTNDNTSSSYEFVNDFTYHQKLRAQGRSYTIGFTQVSSHGDQPASVHTKTGSFDSLAHPTQQSSLDEQSRQPTNRESWNGFLAFTEPLWHSNNLGVSYRIKNSLYHLDKLSYDFDSATGRYSVADSGNSSTWEGRTTSHLLAASLIKQQGNLRYYLTLGYTSLDLLNDDHTLHSRIHETYNSLLVSSTLRWTLPHGSQVIFMFNQRSQAPTSGQLRPIPDPTNPYLIKLGNPGLRPATERSFDGEYERIDVKSGQNVGLQISAALTEQAITNATTALPGGIQQLQFVNVNGNYELSANAFYGFPLPGKGNNASLHLDETRRHEVGLVNGTTDATDNNTATAAVTMHVKPLVWLTFEGNGGITYTATQYTLTGAQSLEFWSHYLLLNASCDLPGALTVSSFYSVQRTGRQGSVPAQGTSRWNASVVRTVFGDKSGQVRLSVYDVLSTASNIATNSGPNFIETTRATLPGRRWLVSFTWHFKSSGAGVGSEPQ